ncbi:MAG: SRPBCC family protein [Pseudonocardiaceae bacterium]
MSDHGFTTSFSVDRTPKEAFDAITNVRGWWSEELDGGTAELGNEFTYRYEDVHRCTIRVTEVVPDRRVSWLVVENYFDFTEDKTEWTGTTISFDISEKDGQTEIRFTHQGLVPEYECFDVCSTSWGFFINGSLRNLITTGEGQPNGRGRRELRAIPVDHCAVCSASGGSGEP